MAHNPQDPWQASQISTDSSHRREISEVFPRSVQPLSKANTRRSESLDLLNEGSPLLSPEASDDDGSSIRRGSTPSGLLHWNEDNDEGIVEESKSVWYLFLLTLSIGGLQIAWAVELSNGSPYLLSLGMSKSLLAFVWIAGPLSGTLVQPYIGIRSDNCRIPWGKRKPFMVAGAVATAISLLVLAWTREIVQGFLGLFGADPESHGVKVSSICFAIAFVYILDFAINTVQAGIRAFIVDNAPTHQQEDANAWAGRITGFGNVLGYLSGYTNLPELTGGVFGDSQFKVLCVIASFALCSTVLVSCFCIKERDPRLEGPPPAEKVGVISFFKQVWHSMRRLPLQIRRVCEVQFFNWIGWFPFLFYITTYIGQLHVNPIFAANPNLTPKEVDDAWEGATRVGTFALLIFAITSFTSNLLLPFIIVPTYRPPPQKKKPPQASFHSDASPFHHHHQPATPGTPGTLSASMTSSFFPPYHHDPSSNPSRLTSLLSACQIPWLTLRRAWLLSHFLFATCMALTFFITTPLVATILVGFVGLSWALSLWAPFALISAEISKRDTAARNQKSASIAELNPDQAGVILGLHNVAIAAPQVIATLVSSLIFKLAQRPRGEPGDDSVGWVLRFGGLAALVAAYMTKRVGEEGVRSGKDVRAGEGSVEGV